MNAVAAPVARTGELDAPLALAVLAVIFSLTINENYNIGEFAFFEFGPCGVYLFFVLSGFLITGQLLEAKQSRDERHDSLGLPLKAFFAKRALRLLPACYLALCGAWIIDLRTFRAEFPWHAGQLTDVYSRFDQRAGPSLWWTALACFLMTLPLMIGYPDIGWELSPYALELLNLFCLSCLPSHQWINRQTPQKPGSAIHRRNPLRSIPVSPNYPFNVRRACGMDGGLDADRPWLETHDLPFRGVVARRPFLVGLAGTAGQQLAETFPLSSKDRSCHASNSGRIMIAGRSVISPRCWHL